MNKARIKWCSPVYFQVDGTRRVPTTLGAKNGGRHAARAYYFNMKRTVPEKVSFGASTIMPAGMPRASRLIASVGQV